MQLSTEVAPNDASQKVVYNSTNVSVATVSSNGLVTAISEGTTQIIATTTDGTNLSDTCEVKVIDNNAIVINDSRMQIGSQYSYPIEMINSDNITAFQCDIHLPKGISVAEVEGDLDIELNSERASNDHTMVCQMVNDSTLRVMAYSMNIKPFVGNTGELMRMNLNVLEEMEEGIYSIKIDNIILSGINDDAYYPTSVSSMVEVYRYEVGDANGDKMVDITDVVSIINVALGNTPSNFQFKVADINGDNQINVLDVVAIAKIILNQAIAPASNAMNTMGMNEPNALVINNVSIKAGETQKVAVMLNNIDDFTAFQMDLRLPQGISLINPRLTNRGTVSHTLNVSQGKNGVTRLISYSPTLANYKNNSGAIIEFELSADEQFKGNDVIRIDNIIFADKNSQGYKLNNVKATIGSISGVDAITSATKIYTEKCQLVIETPVEARATITNVAGITTTVDLAVGTTKLNMAQGFYIVTVNNLTEKEVIK